MPDFTVRVEVHGAAWEDSDALRVEMEAEGFASAVRGSGGTAYELPTGEYALSADLTRQQVLARARRVAERSGYNCAVLVTGVDGTRVVGAGSGGLRSGALMPRTSRAPPPTAAASWSSPKAARSAAPAGTPSVGEGSNRLRAARLISLSLGGLIALAVKCTFAEDYPSIPAVLDVGIQVIRVATRSPVGTTSTGGRVPLTRMQLRSRSWRRAKSIAASTCGLGPRGIRMIFSRPSSGVTTSCKARTVASTLEIGRAKLTLACSSMKL